MEIPRRHNLIRELRQTNCADCALNPVCLPPAIEEGEIQELDKIITRNRPLSRGGVLFDEGTPFEAVFAVRSGAIKTISNTPSGEEQVTGFYLPGEIVGLDSIGNPSGNYGSTAIALETTAVCALPFDALESLAGRLPSLQRHLFQLMSSEIRADQQIMQLVGRRTAEERIATFLLTLAARYKRRKLSENQLHLPMSRSDIANHLGLALETVSRLFTRLQTQDVLRVNGRDVEIVDRKRLLELANGGNEPVASCGT
jgi:CRP/FNR family transcriptional regulator